MCRDSNPQGFRGTQNKRRPWQINRCVHHLMQRWGLCSISKKKNLGRWVTSTFVTLSKWLNHWRSWSSTGNVNVSTPLLRSEFNSVSPWRVQYKGNHIEKPCRYFPPCFSKLMLMAWIYWRFRATDLCMRLFNLAICRWRLNFYVWGWFKMCSPKIFLFLLLSICLIWTLFFLQASLLLWDANHMKDEYWYIFTCKLSAYL
jgi:hypothetical protein